MRKNLLLKFKSVVFIPIVFFGISCGDNFLESLEDSDNIVDAAVALDEGDPDKAITLCLDELGTSYKSIVEGHTSGNENTTQAALSTELDRLESAGNVKNPRNVASILASAYAQKAGVDMIDVALNFATTDSSSSSDNILLSVGESINSNPTSTDVEDVGLALVVLRGIGTANYRSTESFKDSIFQMAQVSLLTASIGDLSDISTADALDILTFLESAIASSAGTSEDPDSDAQASLDQINSIYSEIGVNPGDSDAVKEQKVQDFLDGN